MSKDKKYMSAQKFFNTYASNDLFIKLRTAECFSPFEIRHEDGSFATQQAATIVLEKLSEDLYNRNPFHFDD